MYQARNHHAMSLALNVSFSAVGFAEARRGWAALVRGSAKAPSFANWRRKHATTGTHAE